MDYQARSGLLNGKIILITGAGDGIGKEAAMTFAQFGAQVILLGRTQSKLQQVADDIQVAYAQTPETIALDLLTLNAEQCEAVLAKLQAQYGRLDGLLNNAGLLGQVAPMLEQDPDVWAKVMQVNVNATFMLTQALLPLLLKSKQASLVFTSSGVGKKGRKHWGAYAASKFATEGMVQVLADEFTPTQLRINAINPGVTRTKMRASAAPEEDAMTIATPADIMPIYLYLMGDDSSGVSGVSFNAQEHLIQKP